MGYTEAVRPTRPGAPTRLEVAGLWVLVVREPDLPERESLRRIVLGVGRLVDVPYSIPTVGSRASSR